MSDGSVKLNKVTDNQYEIIGDMTYATTPYLYGESLPLFDADKNELVMDFKNTDEVDSAGFALVVEWQRLAKQRDKLLSCRHVPRKMVAIARLSGLATLLEN